MTILNIFIIRRIIRLINLSDSETPFAALRVGEDESVLIYGFATSYDGDSPFKTVNVNSRAPAGVMFPIPSNT